MLVTKENLLKLGIKSTLVERYIVYLNETLEKYSINTSLRVSNFLAQIFHESGNFHYTQELASGRAYEGRLDLGNDLKGEGVKYLGRGLIQLTGDYTYKRYGSYVKYDFNKNPKDLASPKYACDSAGWFWEVFKKDKFGNNLNSFSDKNDFIKITYFVNGGFNGFHDRLQNYSEALEVFSKDSREELLKELKDNIKVLLSSKVDTTMTKVLKKTLKGTDLEKLFNEL
jgi:putative chitinase